MSALNTFAPFSAARWNDESVARANEEELAPQWTSEEVESTRDLSRQATHQVQGTPTPPTNNVTRDPKTAIPVAAAVTELTWVQNRLLVHFVNTYVFDAVYAALDEVPSSVGYVKHLTAESPEPPGAEEFGPCPTESTSPLIKLVDLFGTLEEVVYDKMAHFFQHKADATKTDAVIERIEREMKNFPPSVTAAIVTALREEESSATFKDRYVKQGLAYSSVSGLSRFQQYLTILHKADAITDETLADATQSTGGEIVDIIIADVMRVTTTFVASQLDASSPLNDVNNDFDTTQLRGYGNAGHVSFGGKPFVALTPTALHPREDIKFVFVSVAQVPICPGEWGSGFIDVRNPAKLRFYTSFSNVAPKYARFKKTVCPQLILRARSGPIDQGQYIVIDTAGCRSVKGFDVMYLDLDPSDDVLDFIRALIPHNNAMWHAAVPKARQFYRDDGESVPGELLMNERQLMFKPPDLYCIGYAHGTLDLFMHLLWRYDAANFIRDPNLPAVTNGSHMAPAFVSTLPGASAIRFGCTTRSMSGGLVYRLQDDSIVPVGIVQGTTLYYLDEIDDMVGAPFVTTTPLSIIERLV